MINILVNGAFGKMGSLVSQTISDSSNLNLVGETGREYDLKKSILDSKADVVIDFTEPGAVFKNAETIIEAGARPIIGTSGLSLSQINELKKRCKELKRGGLIAPNFSIGALMMMKYAKEIVKYMPNAEIIEFHHDGKVDSPSGTSMRTAELLAEAEPKINQPMKPTKATVPNARGALYKQVPIHSIRLSGLLAHQEIIFGSKGETLTLRHDSLDRSCFMQGVMLACEKVMTLNELVYGLEELL